MVLCRGLEAYIQRRLWRTARRRTARWPVWLAGLASLAFALPAGAATDKIVVDEFLLRCVDGSSDGAFVELVAAGPGQTFDAALGVRLLNPSGATVADLPGVFASRAGQPWPAGQRFLIATAQFEPLTGVAPDTIFAAAPASSRGSIIIYRKAGTTITVQSRVDYASTFVLARTPPPGRSAHSIAPGFLVWSPEPTPTRSDGVLARAPGCFADVRRPIRITELSVQCSGDPAGGFIEIAPTADNQSLDGDLELRVFHHSGATLFGLPLGVGEREGTPWPTNRPWLVGDSLLKSPSGNGPDLVWPAPLDPAGGRIALYGRDATGAEVVLSEIEYGTAELPAPPSGASLVWDPFTKSYIQRSPTTPTDFAGVSHSSALCLPPSGIRIRELLTACGTVAPRESYVELTSTTPGEPRDGTLALEVRDAAGTVTAVIPAAFGGLTGTTWPVNTSWLFATGGLTNTALAGPDARLPVALDPVAGRVDVVRTHGTGPGATEVIQSLRWGGTQAAPAAGQSLRRVSEGNYQVFTAPQAFTSSGQSLRCPPAPDTVVAVPVRGIEVCAGCWDGSRRGQYVRLDLNAGQFLDTSFVLRLYNRDGALLGTLPRLFAAASVPRPVDARSWLVTDPGYPASGTVIDARLPAPLDSVAGTVQVVSVRDGVERASAEFRYGAPAHQSLPLGYAFRTNPTSVLVYPAPSSFSRVASPVTGCHFSSSLQAGDPLIGEVFLACTDRDSSRAYIELGGVDPDRILDPRLSLRIFDRAGTLRQAVLHVLPATIPPELHGRGPRTLLIAGPDFAAATGFAPDRTLEQPIRLAGSIELFFQDRVIGEQTSLQFVNYAAGIVPALGRSLVLSPSGGQLSSRHPFALRLNGDTFEIPTGCRDTSVAVPMVLQKLALGCFDGDPRGQFIQLVSSGTDDSLTSAFTLRAYDHVGRLAGEVSPAFGERAGLSGTLARSLLIAHADAPLPIPLDAPIGFALDTLGGTIELVERSAGRERVSWSSAYPASGAGGFIMGSVRQLVAGTWQPGSPLLQNWLDRSGLLTGCHYGWPPQGGLQIQSLLGACGDGALGSSYVELAATAPQPQITGLELQIEDDDTSVTVPLFPAARAFETWAPGQSLLLASDAFAAAMGFAPDRRLPARFGTGVGRIMLRLVDPTQPVPFTLSQEQVDFVTLPEPGRALERAAIGLAPTGTPAPRTFDGIRHPLPPGCFDQSGVPDAVRLSGVMLACGDGGTGAQYVEVERTSALTPRDPHLRLRLLDRDGRSLGEREQLYPLGAGFWGHARALAIGTSEFQLAYGFVPDATLPATMDTVGGTIQLVRFEAVADHVLSELRYGPGGVAVPPRGIALALANGAWGPDTLAAPSGFGGSGVISPLCRVRCDAQRVGLSLSSPQDQSPAVGDFSDTYSDVSYDLGRAQFDVRTVFKRAELLMSDRYVLTHGVLPDTVETFIDVIETHADFCTRNACVHSTRQLHLIVNGEVVDSLLADVREHGRLHARVPFTAFGPTRIQMFASADGLLTPDMPGRVAGRLRFELPANGPRLISCGGYDSDRARVVRGVEWSLSPHAVEIEWSMRADAAFTADVERLDESDPLAVWVRRETRPVESPGVVRFRDTKLRSGATYRYRLTWSDEFGSYTSDEVRVQIDRLPTFGLLSALPNPSRGALRVSFEVPEASAVHLELFDLLGRRVREVRTSLAAGPHEVALDQGQKLAPGLYQVRLGAGGREARLTVVVLP